MESPQTLRSRPAPDPFVHTPPAYTPAYTNRERRMYGLVSRAGGMVRLDFAYRPRIVVTVRPLCWAHGGGFRRDESGPYWLIALSGLRAVLAAFPDFTVEPALWRLAEEQAWVA